ncbi:MAG: hypothetical protein K6G11_02840 [Lachnospiraceae bacterium]|nr:hypothetical protein [Lachnospiraceae bacterium]
MNKEQTGKGLNAATTVQNGNDRNANSNAAMPERIISEPAMRSAVSAPASTSGNASASISGKTSGNASGNTSDKTSGNASGNTSDKTSGNAFGNNVFTESTRSAGLAGTYITINDSVNAPYEIFVPVPGEHMIYNALAAAACGQVLGETPEEIKEGISKLKTISGRNNFIKTDKLTVIDDCYNANPMSMKASLSVLKNADGRKVAILGDMFELGEDENELHAEVGSAAVDNNTDLLIAIGKLSKNTFDAAKDRMNAVYFETKAEFLEKMPELIKAGDTVLVKASHGMEFTEIVEKLSAIK